jgi:hypothetical protein
LADVLRFAGLRLAAALEANPSILSAITPLARFDVAPAQFGRDNQEICSKYLKVGLVGFRLAQRSVAEDALQRLHLQVNGDCRHKVPDRGWWAVAGN